MQVIGTQYALKKITDYVMAPPPQAPEEEQGPDNQPQQQFDSGLDGSIITDDDGVRLGVARKVTNLTIYVLSDTKAGLDVELKRCLTEEGSEVRLQMDDDGRVLGLVYIPSPDRRPAQVAAQRAEDI